MNNISSLTLRAIRKLYISMFREKVPALPECDNDPETASKKILDILLADKPAMIARFGSYEISVLQNYLGVKEKSKNVYNYITGIDQGWWWHQNLINSMCNNTGFFPPDIDIIEKFCELMIQDIPYVDILGSWLPQEHFFEKELQNCQKVNLELLNPYFSSISWTSALEGKIVLVIHPFIHTIKKQYLKRELIFSNNLLPAFELKTIKTVQSIAGEKSNFSDWFEALDFMKSEINKTEFDICIIGCGAYGFPLAAHVKRMGKKGIHLGGSTQLLFGIKGKRWEDENYHNIYNYSRLMNTHWVKPDDEETPKNAEKVEGACYW